MEKKEKKTKSKLMHWLARISTTFGLAGIAWLYLYWLGLSGGVFFLGALCGLTAFEFLQVSPIKIPTYRKVLLSVSSFLMPYLFHRILLDPTRTASTFLVVEVFLAAFILLTFLGLTFKSVLKVISRSLLFPIWGIAMPMTSLIVTAHFFIQHGRTPTQALLWVMVIIFITKATDIGALLVGSWIGKHKMAPTISPAKTIEGAVGGVALSILVAIVIYKFGNIHIGGAEATSSTLMNYGKVILAAGVVSIAGIFGDLYESSWKRYKEIKNSGSILPGLGGMYDLTDSIILAAPVAYFLVKYVLIAG